MSQTVFNRIEKKYMLPQEVYVMLLEKLKGHMEVDEYGLHTICNLYYDTSNYGLIRRSIDKPVYKEKLRLRSYGVPTADSKVFVEIKKKYNKVVNKRRVQMTLKEAYDYVERGIRPRKENATWEEKQIMNEIDFFLQRYPLRRGMWLAYDRIALKGKHDGFRLTFDMNIRNRIGHMGLEYGDSGEHLLPSGFALMETKVMGATPLWFSQILAELAIYPTSFSKYGNFYKKDMHETLPLRQLTHRVENWEERLGVAIAYA